MAMDSSGDTTTSANNDDGANITVTDDAPPVEDGLRNEEPTNDRLQTSAASSENFTVPAAAVDPAPNSLRCRFLPHGAYVFVPTIISVFAWIAYLSKDGCDYASVKGPIVEDITNNPLIPYIHMGLSNYREPTFSENGGWYIDTNLPCQAYNTDVVDIDPAWSFAKLASFISFVFGGGGALFICFSLCFAFRKTTWRWAGYEMLVATISGILSFTWFGTRMCNDGNICSIQYGAVVDIIACVCWALSVLFIFCYYPTEKKTPAVNSNHPPPPAQFEMSDQSETMPVGAATDEREII